MITVIDTETTGLQDGASIVEIACVEYPTSRKSYMTSLVMPTDPISYEAMACHHITSKMVEESPTLAEVLSSFPGITRTEVFVAHNAAFDKKALPEYLRDKPWICTYRVALHLWPDAPSHSNQVLRYYLGLDVSDMPDECGSTPHRALYDAWCTAKLLERQFEEIRTGLTDVGAETFPADSEILEELLRLTVAPVLLRTCRFGKHRGERWEDIPKDYLKWVLRQDMDTDTIHTAKHHLGMLP